MSMVDGFTPARARRTHSLPSKYMIPSEDMGEYESPTRRKSAPEREKPPAGGLFPLSEQGSILRDSVSAEKFTDNILSQYCR
jgi:hypothetical protein